MEIDSSTLEVRGGVNLSISEAVRDYYRKIFGYTFVNGDVIKPTPENTPQFDPTDPIQRHINQLKKKE